MVVPEQIVPAVGALATPEYFPAPGKELRSPVKVQVPRSVTVDVDAVVHDALDNEELEDEEEELLELEEFELLELEFVDDDPVLVVDVPEPRVGDPSTTVMPLLGALVYVLPSTTRVTTQVILSPA